MVVSVVSCRPPESRACPHGSPEPLASPILPPPREAPRSLSWVTPPSVSLIVLRSPDPDELARFYEAMGLRFTDEQHGAGPRHLTAIAAGTVVEIYPATAPSDPGAPNDLRLGFDVDDLDATLGRLVDLTENEPTLIERNGRRLAVMVDPDGRSVELAERR